MIFTIAKYCKRYGKKDDPASEARKIADYAQRLLDYELDLQESEK